MSIIRKDNIDEATAAELQKYMEDKGVTQLRMRRLVGISNPKTWYVDATLVDGTAIAGGPFAQMSDCMAYLVSKLEEN